MPASGDALGERPRAGRRGTPPSRGRERKTRRTPAGMAPAPDPAPPTTASGSPSQPTRLRARIGGQRLADAARRAPRAPAACGSSSDHTSMRPTSRACVGQLEGRRPSVGGDDRQHLPVEPGQALDEQVAPRADAAHRRRGRSPPWSAARAAGRGRAARARLARQTGADAMAVRLRPLPLPCSCSARGAAGDRPAAVRRARRAWPRRPPSRARSPGRSPAATRG